MNPLNLPDWTVNGREEREHDIRFKAEYGVPLSSCPDCKSTDLKRFGKRSALFMDLPMHGKRVGSEVERQRYRCASCKHVRLQPLPDIDEKHDATKRLVEYIAREARKYTFVSVAEQVGVSEGTVRGIFKGEVAGLDLLHKPETPDVLGIDEVHILKRPRCVLANITEGTVIDMLSTHTQQAVANRLSRMPDKGNVEVVAIDMWRPYVAAVRAVFGKGMPIIIDKWHVTKLANQGMEEVRKAVRAGLTDKRRRRLKNDRFLLLKRAHRLEPFEQLIVEAWSSEFPLLGVAYALKEGFYGIYDARDRFEAKQRYLTWLMSVPKELEKPFHPLLRAMRNWEDLIFAYFDFLPDRRITNAMTEALNGLIKDMHEDGRGYSFDVFRAKVLYTHGVRKVRRQVFERGPWTGTTEFIERHREPDVLDYGADISTLIKLHERGEL